MIFVVITSVSNHTSAKELVPLDAFSAMPIVENPQISPNGKLIVAMAPDGNLQSVITSPFDKKAEANAEITRIIKLENVEDRIESVTWLNDQRLLLNLSYAVVLRGQKLRIYHWFAVDPDGKNLQKLELNRVLQNEDAAFFGGVEVVSLLKNDPQHILMESYSKVDEFPAVYKVNVSTGKFDKVLTSKTNVRSWIANDKGEIVAGVKRYYNSNSKQIEVTILYRRDPSSDEWEDIYKYETGIQNYLRIISVIDDSTLLVTTDYGENQVVAREFDLEKRDFGPVVYKAEGYDLGSVITKDDRVVGISYADDYYNIEYFDPELKKRQALMQQTFNKFKVYVNSSSKDNNRLIVALTSSNSPTKYYTVDLANQSASAWLSEYPALEGIVLPGKMRIDIPTSDGNKISGYFTQGENWEESPLIVLPHGGPASRDYQYFDIWVQMLARRGYAVLQVNFRGSSGFGSGFEIDGYKQWGKLMQQDVYDAVKFVGDNYLADPSKACIVGLSYGGYVALTAGFQKPDMFDCIVSINGIADIPDLITKDSAWGSAGKVGIRRRIGDLDIDKERADLEANSASNHVEKFKAPVLLIHGENDTRVHYSQGADFYEVLKEKNKPVEYILLKDGTHFIDTAEHRKVTFEAIDSFISQYLN